MADGTFADLRTHWLGRIGTAAVHFARHRGGVLHVARDPGEVPEPPAPGEAPAHLVSLGTRLRLRSPSGGGTRLVRQENDPAPKFHFLEEGPVRLGMRVAFDLLDENGRYHGDGRQDVWIYPEGDLHVSWALQTVNPVGHGPVEALWAEIDGDAGYRRVRVGDAELSESGTLGGGAREPVRPGSRCACAWRWTSSGREPTSSSPTSSPTPRGWWRPGSTTPCCS